MRLAKIHIIVGVFLVLLVCFAGQALCTEYHVATTGSDAANGSLETPWATLSFATLAGGLALGDTVYIHEGTYDAFWTTATSMPLIVSGSSGVLHITRYQNDSVTINIPAANDTGYFIIQQMASR